MTLFKALFLFCEQREIDWLIITARSPIDREYQAMLRRAGDGAFDDRRVTFTACANACLLAR